MSENRIFEPERNVLPGPRPPVVDSRKLEIAIRDSQHITARTAITSAIIKNPYGVAVEILSVSLTHPWLKELAPVRQSDENAKSKSISIFPKFFGATSISVDMPFVRMHMAQEAGAEENRVIINGDEESTVNINQPLDPSRKYVINLGKKAELNYDYNSLQETPLSPDEPERLPPLSERIASVKWDTGRSLFTTPTRLPIEIEVIYRIESEIRSQVISSTIELDRRSAHSLWGRYSAVSLGHLQRSFNKGLYRSIF